MSEQCAELAVAAYLLFRVGVVSALCLCAAGDQAGKSTYDRWIARGSGMILLASGAAVLWAGGLWA